MDKTISLNQNTLFRRLYYRGKKIACPTLAIYFMRNSLNSNRLGITVSGKIGNAVVRNRIRRQIREVYRLLECSLKSGFDIVIVARHAIIDAPYSIIERDIHWVFNKGSLCR